MSVYIKSLHILSFGQFENLTINFDRGFNLIYGNNEAGKSTIVSFIEGILYGFDEGSKVRRFNEKQKRYLPIGSYKYAGFAVFNKDGTDYRISRNFFDGEYEIYNLDENFKLDTKASNLNYPGEFLLGIDYEIYKNLISNYQSQDTSTKAREKINEILMAKGDYNFSAIESINILEDQLRAIGTDRAYTKPYIKTKAEIEELSKSLDEIQRLRKKYYKDFKDLDKNRTEINKKLEKLKELKVDRDNYRKNIAYQNLEDEIKYQNELNLINDKLERLSTIEPSKDVDEKIKNTYPLLISIIISFIFVLIALFTKIYYLIPLGLLFPVLFLIFDNIKSESSTQAINDMDSAQDNKYREFRELSLEKDKIEEVLRILKNQDKTRDRANMLEINSIDIKETELKIKRYENELEELRKNNIELEKFLAVAERTLSKEVVIEEKLEHLKEKLADMEKEKSALNLAINTINEIIKENFDTNAKIDSKSTELIRSISKGDYKKISYDKELNPIIIKDDRSEISIDKLSTGFIDQLNFAFKFSANNLLDSSILIFDDAFINYDMERLRVALFYLLDRAYDDQIIYMTCHNREKELLDSEDIDYNFINLEGI